MSGAQTPPPEALFLELLDLLALFFPHVVSRARVHFSPAVDGRYPGLTEIDGEAPEGAAQRPALGYSDEEVLGSINAVLHDLTDAVDAEAQFRVLQGRIEIDFDPADQSAEVWLVEGRGGDPDEDLIRLKKRFPQSELNWMLFTPALFAALARTEPATANLMHALDGIKSAHTEFAVDLDTRRLAFSGAAGRVELPMCLLGSWSEDTQSFLWGWANEAAGKALTRKVQMWVDGLSGAGLRALTKPDLGCPESTARRLALHAASDMNLPGFYAAPFQTESGQGVLYLGVESLSPVT
jgi:hypothetical protein